MLQLRNELAGHLREVGTSFSLPEPEDDPRKCANCPLKLPCTLWQGIEVKGRPFVWWISYESLQQRELPSGHFHEELRQAELAHLSDSHLAYFRQWVRLLGYFEGLGPKAGMLEVRWLCLEWSFDEAQSSRCLLVASNLLAQPPDLQKCDEDDDV